MQEDGGKIAIRRRVHTPFTQAEVLADEAGLVGVQEICATNAVTFTPINPSRTTRGRCVQRRVNDEGFRPTGDVTRVYAVKSVVDESSL